MRNLLLSAALVAIPVGVFFAGFEYLNPVASPVQAAAAGPVLGDMSAFTTIISDVQALAKTGDLVGAEARITDFETSWDDAEPTLRPLNAAAWGNVDTAADGALSALRSADPDPAQVASTLTALQLSLADPAGGQSGGGSGGGAITLVSGIAVTDANGHALPCEAMLKDLDALLRTSTLAADLQNRVADLHSKALERCNADDDTRADDFSAQAIALLNPGN